MRTHGWGGSAPASDEEAIERILDASDDAIAQRGGDLRVADVARALGISRQTNWFHTWMASYAAGEDMAYFYGVGSERPARG